MFESRACVSVPSAMSMKRGRTSESPSIAPSSKALRTNPDVQYEFDVYMFSCSPYGYSTVQNVPEGHHKLMLASDNLVGFDEQPWTEGWSKDMESGDNLPKYFYIRSWWLGHGQYTTTKQFIRIQNSRLYLSMQRENCILLELAAPRCQCSLPRPTLDRLR